MTNTFHGNTPAGKLKESLESGFTITAEIPPPKGINPEKNIQIARAVNGRVAAVNVTDNQRGMLRMSAAIFSKFLIEAGCEPILQVCCRDRNRLALQSDLIGAAAMGVKNVCVMTGDYVTLGDHPEAKPVYDLDSVQLIQLIKQLSEGKSMAGKPFKNNPSFFIGGVINPFYQPFELELLKTRKKMKAGADFFQTQPFFDIGSLEAFLESVKGLGSKFLVGITPLKSVKMLEFLNENVLTTPIPSSIKERLMDADDQAIEGLKIAAEFVKSIHDRVDGIHIMPISQVENLPLLLDMIDGAEQ